MAKAPAKAPKQLSASSPEVVVVLLVVFMIIIGVVFKMAVYDDLSAKKNGSQARIGSLSMEIAQLKEQKAQLDVYRNELKSLEQNLSKLKQRLPSTEEDLNLFLQSVDQRARTSRISKWLLFKQEGIVQHGDYAAIPIRIEFEATYDAMIQFFWDLATMGDDNSHEQIVNIQEVEITRSNSSDKKDNATMLKVNFVAETYIYTGGSSK